MEALNVARARLARGILLRADAMHLAAWQDVMSEELPAMETAAPVPGLRPHSGPFDVIAFERIVMSFARGVLDEVAVKPHGGDFLDPSVEMIEALQTLLARELGSRDKLRGMAHMSFVYPLAADLHAAAASRIRWLIDGAVGTPPPQRRA